MFSFARTAQEAGAGGRSGAAGNPVHGSLMFQNTIQSESKFIHFNMNIAFNNTFSKNQENFLEETTLFKSIREN